jgi:hypothetical protein
MDTTKDAVEGETKRSTSSRREFLRMAGTGLAGAFAAAALGCVSFETLDVYPWAEAEALLFGPDATRGASTDAASGATA